jgi:hypothetical protein
VEVDECDVGDALEGELGVAGVGGEEGVGFGDVQRDVLPDLHVHFFYVQVLQAVVYQ